MKRLTIISHTAHYETLEGEIVGFVSTVTEINQLLEVFDEINHVAMLHNGTPPNNTLSYSSKKIKFIPIPALGGPTLKNKFELLINIPKILSVVSNSLSKSDYFQFRAPTGIGVFIIPYILLLNTKKKGWFKYAGNWQQKNAPTSYKFQRWLLKRQNRLVTINGNWSNQPKQCLTFENPCLTNSDLSVGSKIIEKKSKTKKDINLCFVGRLEEEKGFYILIEALNNLSIEDKMKINTVHLVGDSQENHDRVLEQCDYINFEYHGVLSRENLFNIYAICHAIILPSKSEGFPKVIIEALNYGCLPIVTGVSSITQYVNDKINGLIIESNNSNHISNTLSKFLGMQNKEYGNMIINGRSILSMFTFSHYNHKIKKYMLKE